MAIQSPVVWAQREDCIFVTIQQADTKDPELSLTADKLTFKAKVGPEDKEYHAEIEFYEPIDVDASTKRISQRELFFNIKKTKEGPYWPRLTKEKVKYQWLKVDFSKWKDEDDEEDEAPDVNLGGMEGFGGPGGMGGMGGPGGMGGMGGMDMQALLQQMGGAGGMGGLGDLGGMGGDDEGDAPEGAAAGEDSDDDDMPDLE